MCFDKVPIKVNSTDLYFFYFFLGIVSACVDITANSNVKTVPLLVPEKDVPLPASFTT